MDTRTKKLVASALIAALACIATIIIKIPSPLKGYLNLGDCIVLVAGWTLSPTYAFLSAGLGSALADLFSGYLIYAPATFLIKGLMAVVVFYTFKFLKDRFGVFASEIIGGILAELIMILGYYIFEGSLYGFTASLVNIPANAVQGAAGVIIGVLLMKVFEKHKMTMK